MPCHTEYYAITDQEILHRERKRKRKKSMTESVFYVVKSLLIHFTCKGVYNTDELIRMSTSLINLIQKLTVSVAEPNSF